MTREEAVAYCRAHGLPLYGAALSPRAQDLRKLRLDRSAVAIGSEGHGLSAELLSQCDGELIIPMSGAAESLNAGVAAAIVMWEMCRGEA
jgi:TrmH family RNA methyltransferase